MNLDFLSTRIDFPSRSNPVDIAITPVRWLMNGRRYEVVLIKNNDDGSIGYFAFAYEKREKLSAAVLRIVGLIATIALFPIVACGLLWKIKSTEASFKYHLFQDLTSKATFISSKALSLKPKPIPEPPCDDLEVTRVDLNQLDALWDTLKEERPGCDDLIQELKEWIKDSVPYPEKYSFINAKVGPLAAESLQLYLKAIAARLSELKSPKKTEQVLVELNKASKVCAPTWLEVAKREYVNLYVASDAENRILKYIQEIKEEIIQDFINRIPGSHWNTLNDVRWAAGQELGLDDSLTEYDATVSHQEKNETKNSAVFLLKHSMTPKALCSGVKAKLELEYAGSHQSIQIYGPLLRDYCADKHAKDNKINTTSDDYDRDEHVTETFFDMKDGTYVMNEKGAYALLRHLGIFVSAS